MRNNLIHSIKEKGHRITPLLRVLLDIFYESDSPLSISDLKSALGEKKEVPNKTTLYRQLERLTKMNILEENIFSDTVRRYCLKHKSHHHHFICEKCGFIKNVNIDDCEKTAKELANKLKRKGYLLNDHIMTFSGICNNCLNV